VASFRGSVNRTNIVKQPPDFPDLKKYKLIDTDIDEFRKWLPGGVQKFTELFGG